MGGISSRNFGSQTGQAPSPTSQGQPGGGAATAGSAPPAAAAASNKVGSGHRAVDGEALVRQKLGINGARTVFGDDRYPGIDLIKRSLMVDQVPGVWACRDGRFNAVGGSMMVRGRLLGLLNSKTHPTPLDLAYAVTGAANLEELEEGLANEHVKALLLKMWAVAQPGFARRLCISVHDSDVPLLPGESEEARHDRIRADIAQKHLSVLTDRTRTNPSFNNELLPTVVDDDPPGSFAQRKLAGLQDLSEEEKNKLRKGLKEVICSEAEKAEKEHLLAQLDALLEGKPGYTDLTVEQFLAKLPHLVKRRAGKDQTLIEQGAAILNLRNPARKIPERLEITFRSTALIMRLERIASNLAARQNAGGAVANISRLPAPKGFDDVFMRPASQSRSSKPSDALSFVPGQALTSPVVQVVEDWPHEGRSFRVQRGAAGESTEPDLDDRPSSPGARSPALEDQFFSVGPETSPSGTPRGVPSVRTAPQPPPPVRASSYALGTGGSDQWPRSADEGSPNPNEIALRLEDVKLDPPSFPPPPAAESAPKGENGVLPKRSSFSLRRGGSGQR